MSIDDQVNGFLGFMDDPNARDNDIRSILNQMGFQETNTDTFAKENQNFNDWSKKDNELIYKDIDITHNLNGLKDLNDLPKDNRKYCTLSGNEKKVRAWGVK